MKHKITRKDYYDECGDGCCVEYGGEWHIDGELVHRGPCEDNAWLAVLKYLGIDAELTGQNEIGEDTWSL